MAQSNLERVGRALELLNKGLKTFKVLGYAERSLVSELRDTRNKWAHQKAFSTDNLYRALDSIHLLLTSISAEEASEIERQKQ